MLRHKEDIRSLAFQAIFIGLVAVGFIWRPTEWYFIVPLVIITAQFSFFCAVITHNTVHTPPFRKRWMNKLNQVWLTLTYGHPVSAYVPGHNLSHHLHTQTERDIMRTTKARFRWNLLNQLFFFYIVSGAVTKANFQYVRAMYKDKPSWFRQFVIEGVVYLSAMVTLLVIDWQSFLLYVLIPHQFAGWGIVGINFVQHDGCDPDHPQNHSRNITGRWTNWWTFNNGFHGIHHEEPSLHWSKLRDAHYERIHPGIHPNLEQPSLFMYCWRAYIWPGKRVTFDGEPVILPEREPADQPWIPKLQDLGKTSIGAET